MNEFIITFRESLEAALIVGIIYTFLEKNNIVEGKKKLWLGLGLAIILSLAVGIVLQIISSSINNDAYEKLFEAGMMYLAAGFLIYMVVWMSKNTNIKSELESQAKQNTGAWGIFWLVLFAVLREGFETALFLFASFKTTDQFSYFGFFAGIILASGIGYLIFIQGKRIPIKKFFNISSVLLILFAAGMVAYGTHEAEEFLEKTHVIDEKNISRPWDILKPSKDAPAQGSEWLYTQKGEKYVHILHDKGSIGENLKGFFGYNSNPNWIEFLLWLTTLIGSFYLWNKSKQVA